MLYLLSVFNITGHSVEVIYPALPDQISNVILQETVKDKIYDNGAIYYFKILCTFLKNKNSLMLSHTR